jgi:hypothetical protein
MADAPDKLKMPWTKGYQREGDGPAGPKHPPALAVVNILPTDHYFVWHPSGPGYCNTIAGYTFVDGRIPGAVNGQVAQLMQAFGARVERYRPGLEIEGWEHLESGGLAPVFSLGPEPEATPAPAPPAPAEVVSDPEPEQVQEDAAQPASPPPPPPPPLRDWGRADKATLRAECAKRGLRVNAKSVPKMLAALEADDRARD